MVRGQVVDHVPVRPPGSFGRLLRPAPRVAGGPLLVGPPHPVGDPLVVVEEVDHALDLLAQPADVRDHQQVGVLEDPSGRGEMDVARR